MSTVDNVWENVKAAFDIAEKKTTEVVEISKKKLQVKKLEEKIKGMYAELGYIYYTSRKKSIDVNNDEVENAIALIDEAKKELKKLRDEINDMQCNKKCAKCGAGMKDDDVFCSRCGEKVE